MEPNNEQAQGLYRLLISIDPSDPQWEENLDLSIQSKISGEANN
jgi:hypothetical protein